MSRSRRSSSVSLNCLDCCFDSLLTRIIGTTKAVPRRLWSGEGQEDEYEEEEWIDIAESDDDGSDSGEFVSDPEGSPLRRSQRVANMTGGESVPFSP